MNNIVDALLSVVPSPGIRLRSVRPGDHKTTCPACSHTRRKKDDPCLSVTITEEARGDTKALWKCHHCNWSGWTGTGRFARIRGAERKVYKRPTIKPVPPQRGVLDWLASRCIPEHVVRAEKVFAAEVWMPQSQQREMVVAFPFLRDGEVVNVKYREPAKKWFRQESDAEPIPYGLDCIRGAREIIICEGELDRLSLLAVGFKAVISVPDGAPKKELPEDSPKFAWIEACIEDLERADKIILAVDADEPGQALKRELVRRVGQHKSWWVEWPRFGEVQINDANQMLMVAGEEDLRKQVEMALPVSVEGELTVHDFWGEIEAMHRGGTIEWFSPGFDGALDDVYRVIRGQVTVVTGWPNEGKSTFLDNILVNMALEHVWRFTIFSPENDPARHAVNLLEKAARQPFFDGPTPRLSMEEVRSYRAWLAEHFHFLKFARKEGDPKAQRRADIDWIIRMAEYHVRRYGIDGVVIDPYNRIAKPLGMGAISETDHVLDLMDSLQAFAQRNNVHVWLVAHPAKQPRGKDGKRPSDLSLQDVSGSANFENATDMGFSVQRLWTNEVTGEAYKPRETPVRFNVLKVRERHGGQKGAKVDFSFDFATGRYAPKTGHDGRCFD